MNDQIKQKLIEDIDNNVVGLTNIQIMQIADIINSQPPADQWIPCSERLPDTEEEVMITLTHTYEDEYRQRSVARYLRFENGGAYWCDNRYGYIGWDKYSDGYAGTSNYKVTAWMPLPEPYKGVE